MSETGDRMRELLVEAKKNMNCTEKTRILVATVSKSPSGHSHGNHSGQQAKVNPEIRNWAPTR